MNEGTLDLIVKGTTLAACFAVAWFTPGSNWRSMVVDQSAERKKSRQYVIVGVLLGVGFLVAAAAAGWLASVLPSVDSVLGGVFRLLSRSYPD